jgi:hypothetical protein
MMSQPVAPPPLKAPPPRRRRTWLKVLVFFALVLACFFGYKAWINHRDTAELNRVLAELDQSDPQWQLTHLLHERKPLPAGTDAAAEVIALQKLLTIHESMAPGSRNAWWTMQSDLYRKQGLDRWESFRQIFPNARIPAEVLEKLNTLYALAPAPEVFERTRKLHHLEHGQYQHVLKTMMVMTLLPDVQGSRGLANHMGFLAQIKCQAGQTGEAVEQLQGIFGIARSFENDPFYISHLVRMAIDGGACRDIDRLLAQATPLTDAQLQVLQEELARELKLTENLLYWSVRCERTTHDYDLAVVQEGRMTLGQVSRTTGRALKWQTNIPALDDTLVEYFPELLVGWGNRPTTLPRERVAQLQFFAAALAWAKLPEDQWTAGLARLEQEGPLLTGFLRNYNLYALGERTDSKREIASLRRIQNAVMQQRARLRSTQALIAAERFRLAHNRLPTQWNDLVPRFLPAAPIDPFTAKPLLIKTVPDGVSFYSVGIDLKDSNGMVHETEELPAKDIGAKLWDTKHRAIDLDKDWKHFRQLNYQ